MNKADTSWSPSTPPSTAWKSSDPSSPSSTSTRSNPPSNSSTETITETVLPSLQTRVLRPGCLNVRFKRDRLGSTCLFRFHFPCSVGVGTRGACWVDIVCMGNCESSRFGRRRLSPFHVPSCTDAWTLFLVVSTFGPRTKRSRPCGNKKTR